MPDSLMQNEHELQMLGIEKKMPSFGLLPLLVQPIQTPWKALNKLFSGGLVPGELVVVVGSAESEKLNVLMRSVVLHAAESGCHTVYLSHRGATNSLYEHYVHRKLSIPLDSVVKL